MVSSAGSASDAERDEVRRQIAEDRAVLAGATAASPVILESLVRLGSNLIPMGGEAEAVVHLEAAMAMAQKLGQRDQEIRALLHLGTARQYLGERECAGAVPGGHGQVRGVRH